MKKIMVALLMAALLVGVAFAGEGFTMRAQVEGNLFTQTAGENGTTSAGFFTGLDNGAGDFDLTFQYDDPDGLYGAKVNFDLGSDSFKTSGKQLPHIGTAFAWVKIANLIKVSAGRDISYRAIEKVGGDKDFGVQGMDPDDDGYVSAITTSDPFKFGSGLVLNVLTGPLNIGLFAGPSQGIKVWNQDGTVAPDGTKTYWNGEMVLKETLDLFNYQYGASAKYASDLVDVGAAFKMTRYDGKSIAPKYGIEGDTDTIIGYYYGDADNDPSTPDVLIPVYGTKEKLTGLTNGDWGKLSLDFGLYAQIKAVDGLTIGVGYAGSKGWKDQKEDAGKHDPFRSGINLDAKYTLGALTAGLYNNISFWSRAEDAEANVSEYKVFYLFDELNVAYAVTPKLTADFRARNYLFNNEMKVGDETVTSTMDRLALRAGVDYKVVPDKASVWVRLQFTTDMYSGSEDGMGHIGNNKEAASMNNNTFSIPVGVKVTF
jgi:hypothetical protein